MNSALLASDEREAKGEATPPLLSQRGNGSTETELRLAIRPDDISRLLRHPLLRAADQTRPKMLSSIYFDTSDRKVQKAGLSLRVRRAGNRRIQTIKALAEPDGCSPYSRTEWEHDVDGDAPDDKLFAGTPLESLVGTDSLAPVFETRVERTIRRVKHDDCDLEVSIDRGEIGAGGRKSVVSEVEIERKKGHPRGIFDVAHALCAAVPLRLVIKSKSERGYQLADGQESLPWKAMTVALPPKLPVKAAFQRIGQECLRHLAESMRALLDNLDEDALHQMRVAIRRLRAAMSLFKHVLADAESKAMKARLAGMADRLGEARNLEVFAATLAHLDGADPGQPGLAEFHADVDAHREQAFREARDLVAATNYHLEMIELARWLAVGSWLVPAGAEPEEPVRKLACREMKRRRAAIRKAVRKFDELDTAQLHKLRIRVKKLRYACEFFDGILTDGKRKKTFLSASSELQKGLGDLNDLVVAQDLVLTLTLRADRSAPDGRIDFAAGFVKGQLASKAAAQLKAARKAGRHFSTARRYW